MTRLAPWLALAGALACAGPGVRGDELPERGIALHYLDPESVRRRLEAREDAGPTEPAREGEAVARAGDVADYIAGIFGGRSAADERVERRFPGRLALLDPRGGEVEVLRLALPGAVPRAVSADGRRLLFSQGFRAPQLFELDREHETVRALTRPPGAHPDGCYLPDGRLVFVRMSVENRRPLSHIYLTEPGGVRARRISDGPNDFSPACAPDGSAVVWVRSDGVGPDSLVSRAPVDEGAPRRIGPGADPSFSPDGQWVAYSARIGRRWQLHRIRADGTGRRRIGGSNLHERQPTFSPDGRLVAYISDDGWRRTLYVRRFDGSGDRVLLESGGGSSPIW